MTEIASQHASELPVLRIAVLRRLAEDLACEKAAMAFVDRFLQLLPGRVELLETSLRQGETDVALDGALSLRVTASMAGAARVASVAERIQSQLCDGSPAAALPELTALRSEVWPLMAALRQVSVIGLATAT